MKQIMLLLFILGLTACSVLPPAQPVSQYRLAPAAPVAEQASLTLKGLRLARPQAVGVHTGNRLLVLTGQQSYQAYGDARWNAPMPLLWQDWLLDALWQDGRFDALSREEDSMQAGWELAGTLRAFEVDVSQGLPQALIRFDAQLLRTSDRRIVASRRFEQRAELASRDAAAAVAGLSQAANRLAAELSHWLLIQTP